MNKLLIICGATATGKTSLALSLAQNFNGELIAADAQQIYQGLDILTGKDIPPGYVYTDSSVIFRGSPISYFDAGTRIWLVGQFPRDSALNAHEFKEAAKLVTRDVLSRHRLPILVGGTGFYIDSVTGKTGSAGAPPDYELRIALEALPVSDLQSRLQTADPIRWQKLNQSDRNNPRRLIRAIELAGSQTPAEEHYPAEDILQIGLSMTMPGIEEHIKARIDERLARGVMQEVLGTSGPLPVKPLGFSVLRRVLNGEISIGEGKKLWFLEERQYAKRQLTWFKKNPRIVWFTLPRDKERLADYVRAWYTR